MKKATIVFLAVVFGLFFGSGSAFACGHGHDGGEGGGHEMMTPEGGHGGEGHVCPCHEAGEQNVPDTTPSPSKPEMKSGQSPRELFQHHPGFGGGEEQNGSHGEGHVCPHHK